MRANYFADAKRIETLLTSFERAHGALPGIADPARRVALIEQIIDSEQRVRYTTLLQSRGVSPLSADPANVEFDPLKAAIVQRDGSDYDEAVWLVYLFVHFGKHRRAGWRYARDVYGRLGEGGRWDWVSISTDPTSFRYWLEDHQSALIAAPGPRGFGNHRKYESLNAWDDTGTGAAVASYVEWVIAAGGDHRERFAEVDSLSQEEGFDHLFRSMSVVRRFGRIARFDFLTMVMKLGLLDIRPPHSYLVDSTGPLAGARLLLDDDGDGDGTSTARELQVQLATLSRETGLSPDVMEDAVCNWQKSPDAYVRFSG